MDDTPLYNSTMHRTIFAILTLLLCCGLQAQEEKPPAWSLKFGQFAVSESFHGKPALPRLTDPKHRTYRTAIARAVRKGPNFAGHYSIAEIGCGSGCMFIVVVDAVTGKAYSAPFASLSFPAGGIREYQGPVYQIKSRLLIADGCADDQGCGAHYYEWKDNRFKLLRFEAVAK
jgi:hypothetical protein